MNEVLIYGSMQINKPVQTLLFSAAMTVSSITDSQVNSWLGYTFFSPLTFVVLHKNLRQAKP